MLSDLWSSCLVLLDRAAAAGAAALVRAGPRPPVEVLLVDGRRRRAVARAVRAALDRLTGATGAPLPDGFAVVVQQTVHAGSAVAGCHHRGRRADGGPLALVRLALRVDGRPVDRDELLAALAEQVVALALADDPVDAAPPLEFDARRAPVSDGHPLRPVHADRSDWVGPAAIPLDYP